MNRILTLVAVCLTAPLHAGAPKEDTGHYLRPTPKGFVSAARFVVHTEKSGWSITSTTGGGEQEMTVTARYDAMDRLLAASASLVMEDYRATVTIECKDGTATVTPKDKPQQTFPVAAGVIVTSAPDWSDIFLLCRRCDANKDGAQFFVGLWVHPTQPAQLLKFSIERQGTDTLKRGDKEVTLTRYQVSIRGPSTYFAWADERGALIKLMPAAKTEAGLIREGWETAWKELRPH